MTLIAWAWEKKRLMILIPFIFLIAGCGSVQQEMMAKDSLERARSAYMQAQVNRNVEAYAPIPLADAGKAVKEAEQAKNYETMAHLAYLAEKKSQIAVAIAEGKMAERETEKFSRETAEILLQKREQEARLAKKEAEQAKAVALARAEEAEKARMEAEAKAREVEQARLAAMAEAERAERSKREAEAKAREAEQARLAALAEADKAAKARAEAARAKAEADQLMRELSDLKAKQTERGIVLTIGDVLFATGKSDLSPEANRNVAKLVDFLQKHETRNVLIEGHTDSVGSDEFNLELSQKRAEAVKAELVAKGVAEERINTRGYGKKYSVASNDTAVGRQQNRRVEVIILNEGVRAETQFRE